MCAPGGDSEVGPPVTGAEVAEINVAGAIAVLVEERVGGAGVAVADDESIDGWCFGDDLEGLFDVEMLMLWMPSPPVELAGGGPVAGIGHALVC
jgi:hypothetical protein